MIAAAPCPDRKTHGGVMLQSHVFEFSPDRQSREDIYCFRSRKSSAVSLSGLNSNRRHRKTLQNNPVGSSQTMGYFIN